MNQKRLQIYLYNAVKCMIRFIIVDPRIQYNLIQETLNNPYYTPVNVAVRILYVNDKNKYEMTISLSVKRNKNMPVNCF